MEACSSKLDMESVQIRAWEWSENQFEEPRTQPNSSSQMDNDAREYWRPSYMFHWLRSIGRQMIEAYIAFEEYKGRTSYQEMELDKPRQIPRDDDGSEWSHMSDYDEFGLSPVGDEDQNRCNHSKKVGFVQLLDDLPNLQKHRLMVQK